MSQFSPIPPGGIDARYQLNYQSAEQEMTVGRFFNAVYAWMAVGLGITAIVAYWVANFAPNLLNMGTVVLCFILQLVLVTTISNAIYRVSTGVATALFIVYSATMG